jgi:hypothetical protein
MNTEDIGDIENAYYKDLDGTLGSMEGTWILQNGTTYLKLRLRKREVVLVPTLHQYYQDYLIGEYEYSQNGIEKVNTLSNFMTDYIDISKYNLYSVAIIPNDFFPLCPNCPAGSKRVVMEVNEPLNDDSGIRATFAIRKILENNVEKLHITFSKRETASTFKKGNTKHTSIFRNFSLPYGEYTLIKQP